MENYLSQIMARAAQAEPPMLQPAEQRPHAEGAMDIETSAPASDLLADTPEPLPAVLPVPVMETVLTNITRSFSQPVANHHHYLNHYINRSAEAELHPGSASAMNIPAVHLAAELKPEDIHPALKAPPALPAEQSSLPADRISLTPPAPPIIPPVEQPVLPLLQPVMAPVHLLQPAAPATSDFQVRPEVAAKRSPALTIGKILVEIVPARQVPPPPRNNRPSPFQLTASTGKSGTSVFGLGQL